MNIDELAADEAVGSDVQSSDSAGSAGSVKEMSDHVAGSSDKDKVCKCVDDGDDDDDDDDDDNSSAYKETDAQDAVDQ